MLIVPAIGLVALFGAACTDDAGDDGTTTPTATTTTAPTSTATATATATGTPAGEPMVLVGTVAAVGDGDTGGVVTLTEVDGETEVVVTLTGLEEGMHANHIHAGSCDAPGDVAFPLEELEADAEGGATATSTVAATTEELSDGYYFTVHAGGNDAAGDAVGCADFVAQ